MPPKKITEIIHPYVSAVNPQGGFWKNYLKFGRNTSLFKSEFAHKRVFLEKGAFRDIQGAFRAERRKSGFKGRQGTFKGKTKENEGCEMSD